MDLRQLELLQAVAETGSFTRAGSRLHVSQSAVSRQILLLEEELNEPLFTRFGRHVQITPAGEALLQLSYRVLTDIRDTSANITDRRRTLRGTVRLVGGMTVCLYVFPPLIKAFKSRHPDVEINVAVGGNQRLLRRVRTGRADLALLSLPIDDTAVATVPVMREELMLVMPVDHPLADLPDPIDPEALAGQPFVMFEAGSNTRHTVEAFFLKERIKPRVVTETENVEIIKAMVAAGLGVSIVPVYSVEAETSRGTLRVARLKRAQLVRDTAWVYRAGERVPRLLQEIMATLESIDPRRHSKP